MDAIPRSPRSSDPWISLPLENEFIGLLKDFYSGAPERKTEIAHRIISSMEGEGDYIWDFLDEKFADIATPLRARLLN